MLLALTPAVACGPVVEQAATRSGQGPPPRMSEEWMSETQDSELVPQVVDESLAVEEGAASEEARPTPPVAQVVQPQRRLGSCGLGRWTSTQVGVRVGNGSSTIDLGPGVGQDDRARRCVHQALVPIDVEGQLSRGSPSDRPSGFTALFQLEW